MAHVNGTEVVEDITQLKGVKTDKEAALKVLEVWPHWVCCNGSLFVFDESTGMWSDDFNIHFKVLGKMENHLHKLVFNNKEQCWTIRLESYGNDVMLAKKVFPFLKAFCINNDWIKEKSCSSLGKILFLNGIYDMHNSLFSAEFDPEIVFFASIPIKYKKLNDDGLEYMQDVKKRFFENPLGNEVGDFLML